MVTVRLFAAAREAAGADRVDIEPGPVIPQLQTLGPGFVKVLAVSTVICDGLRLGPDDQVEEGAVVDVLPPFAGG